MTGSPLRILESLGVGCQHVNQTSVSNATTFTTRPTLHLANLTINVYTIVICEKSGRRAKKSSASCSNRRTLWCDHELVFEVTGKCDIVEKALRDVDSYMALCTDAAPDSVSSAQSVVPRLYVPENRQLRCKNLGFHNWQSSKNGFATFNLPTKFVVCIDTHCEDMKGNTKCQKWGGLG